MVAGVPSIGSGARGVSEGGEVIIVIVNQVRGRAVEPRLFISGIKGRVRDCLGNEGGRRIGAGQFDAIAGRVILVSQGLNRGWSLDVIDAEQPLALSYP